MKDFIERIRKTVRFYRSLSKKPRKAAGGGVKIRPDAVAFLTCPYPVLKSEHKSDS